MEESESHTCVHQYGVYVLPAPVGLGVDDGAVHVIMLADSQSLILTCNIIVEMSSSHPIISYTDVRGISHHCNVYL